MNASHIESNKYAAQSIGSYHVNIWKSEYQRNRMKTFDLKKKKKKTVQHGKLNSEYAKTDWQYR